MRESKPGGEPISIELFCCPKCKIEAIYNIFEHSDYKIIECEKECTYFIYNSITDMAFYPKFSLNLSGRRIFTKIS